MDAKDKTLAERVEHLEQTAKDVRRHIIDMIYEAQSGHPGGALSAADFVTALYFDIMRLDPANPRWPDRDRFILSKGHGVRQSRPVLRLTTFGKGKNRTRLTDVRSDGAAASKR